MPVTVNYLTLNANWKAFLNGPDRYLRHLR